VELVKLNVDLIVVNGDENAVHFSSVSLLYFITSTYAHFVYPLGAVLEADIELSPNQTMSLLRISSALAIT
jgi:hypothetical protein